MLEELEDYTSEAYAEESVGRTPPQDLQAEQSVLGAMMMSKDAISDVVEVLRGSDFYQPRHETIFEAVISLYGRGEPADPITVAAELGRSGDLQRVGGAVYLHDLLASISIAANASYYAEIVREKAVLRRSSTPRSGSRSSATRGRARWTRSSTRPSRRCSR